MQSRRVSRRAALSVAVAVGVAAVAAVPLLLSVLFRITDIEGVHFGPPNDCGPALVAALDRDAIFQAAADGGATVDPEAMCWESYDPQAADAEVTFNTAASAETIAMRFRDAAARSGWRLRPVSAEDRSDGVLGCARKEVAGQEWVGYVIDEKVHGRHSSDPSGFDYRLTVLVDADDHFC